MIFRLSFLIILFLISACSKDSSSPSRKQQVESTQIGSEFNRKIDPLESIYSHSIFQVKSEMSGTQGVAVYLGTFNNLKLFLTNKHIIDSAHDDCDLNLVIKDIKTNLYLGCKDLLFSFKNLDLTILAMDKVLDENPDFEFRPVEFNFKDITPEKPLVLRTLDLSLAAVVNDDGPDCKVLDSQVKKIVDPDQMKSEGKKIESYSLPVGCDAKPGDSGSPVFDKSGLVVGILWGGKLNKKYISSQKLKAQVQSRSKKIWLDYNFIVPAKSIYNELKKELSDLNSSSSSALNSTAQPMDDLMFNTLNELMTFFGTQNELEGQ